MSITAQCSCTCICGEKDLVYKAEQDQRLIHFLMGLNDIYSVIRGGIIMMNPLPSIAQVFSLLVQDEHQRKLNHLITSMWSRVHYILDLEDLLSPTEQIYHQLNHVILHTKIGFVTTIRE